MCLFVKHWLARRHCRLGFHFRSGFSFRAHPGSRWLGKFGLQKLLGYHLTRRQQPHLSEHAVELALCRIAVRLAVEKLFESLLGSFPLLPGNQGITQIRQRIGQTERIAGAAVQFHEPFERLDSARHAGRQLAEDFPDNLMLPGIDHGQPRLRHDFHGLFAIPGLQERFDHLLHGPKIFLVRFKYALCESRGLVPVGILEIKIEEEFGLLAAFFEIGRLFKKLRRLSEIALRRIRSRFDDNCSQIAGLEFQRLVRELFSFSMITAGQGALRSGDVRVDGLPSLTHGLVQIGQAGLDTEIIGFRLQQLLQQPDGLRLAIVFQVNLRQLEEQGPGLAHDPLLNVEIGKLF